MQGLYQWCLVFRLKAMIAKNKILKEELSFPEKKIPQRHNFLRGGVVRRGSECDCIR